MRVRMPSADDLAFVSAIQPNATVAGFVPARYDAYLRCFHAAEAMNPDRTWRKLRWKTAAAIQHLVMEPTTQWRQLTGSDDQAVLADGTLVNPPPDGRLPAEELDALSETLLAETTATSFNAAFWTGWEQLSVSTTAFGRRLALVVHKGPWVEFGYQRYALTEMTRAELLTRSWTLEPAFGWPVSGLTPALLWPRSEEWCLATDIDFDSSVLGCSSALAARVMATPTLECAELDLSANLSEPRRHQ